VAGRVTGSRTVPTPGEGGAKEEVEGKICSVIAVENQDMSPGTVRELKMPVITAGAQVIFPGTVRNLKRRGSRFATPVGKGGTWHGTVTTPTSRSATPVEASDTSRRDARRSNVTGVEIGHVAVHCSKASEVNCYNCGKSGHLAKECTIEASA